MSLFFAPSRKLAAERLDRGGPRIYDPRERMALGALDLMLRGVSRVTGLRPRRDPVATPRANRVQRVNRVNRVKSILALRLDRLGDLLMTLPALQSLRAAAPDAHLELAVGSWNEAVARRLPFVDGVRIVDAPWASWGKKVRFADARRAMRPDGVDAPDLVIDFQGDVRVSILMALTGATLRAGYGETGGGYLLTHPGAWDETKSWYWQNLELVKTLYPDAEDITRPYNFVTAEDRKNAAAHLDGATRPRIGIHPSAGRALKQWEEKKFTALIDRLSETASVLVTGASGDKALVERIVAGTHSSPKTLLGTDLATFAAVVESFDVFVSGDTGPMHLAHAVSTPNVAIFGPSDPVRYGPSREDAPRFRTVVRTPVYCSPCNMIRRPPKECMTQEAPDCIAGVSVDQVLDAIERTLSQASSSD